MLNLPKKGGIILLHDIHKTSVEAVPLLIEALKKKNYKFIDIMPLLKAPPKPKMPNENEIKPLEGKGKITATELNVRTGPSTDFSPITTLKKGIEVEYLGEYKGWKKIRFQTLEGPKIGWISGKYVRTIGMVGFIHRAVESNERNRNRDSERNGDQPNSHP
ncbi:MAG: hypothetical protein D6785_03275 [Planctomycetota bacterium]|nr:MAG: hypothetical protein D6785_03275 [Planctomycetota bacterium]